jgi:hypothetical protein
MNRRGSAGSFANPPGAIERFDYQAAAEVFLARGARASSPVTYRRFARASEAVRFVIEELPPPAAAAAVLEVAEDRFDARAIRELYDRPGYPLTRQ